MKIFIDTNIFLDLILQRDNYEEALHIFNAVEKGVFDAIVLDITLLNIDYIATKQTKNVRDFLRLVNSLFTVVGATNDMISEALAIKNSDLEDNLQYISAKSSQCDAIITNDKKFYKGEIALLSAKEFVKQYLA